MFDTEIWDEAWFEALPPKLKSAYCMIWMKADCAGFWPINFKRLSDIVGAEITEQDFAAFGSQLVKVGQGHYWITRFCAFLYGRNGLSRRSTVHWGAIKILADHGLMDAETGEVRGVAVDFLRPSEPFKKPLESLSKENANALESIKYQNQNQDQNKNQNISEGGECEGSEVQAVDPNPPHPVASFERRFQKSFDYLSIFNLYPKHEQKSAALRRLADHIETPSDFDEVRRAVTRFRDYCIAQETEYKFIPKFCAWWEEGWRDWLDDKTGTSTLPESAPGKSNFVTSLVKKIEERQGGSL